MRAGTTTARILNLPAAPDPTYDMRTIGQAVGHTVSKLDVAKYMYARPLQYAPGTNSAYSNYGYLLLSAVVEKKTGLPYFTYVQQKVLAPLGINEVLLSSTTAPQRDPNEAICEDQGLGNDPINLASNSADTRCLRRRWPDQGGGGGVRRSGRFSHCAHPVHSRQPGVGQRPAATQFRQLVARPDRQHTRHVHRSGVDECWRRPRLGLRHQHARLPAANAVAATQPRNHDRQHYRSHAVALTLPASRRDAITVARKQIPGAALDGIKHGDRLHRGPPTLAYASGIAQNARLGLASTRLPDVRDPGLRAYAPR